MIYPKFIKSGNVIGVPAPSAGASDDLKINKFNNAKKNLEKLGYSVVLSDNIFNDNKGRSASSEIRAKEINDMFKSSDIDMILCATGGEFLVEMLPYVDFELLKSNLKYVCGFSDPTGLLYPITTNYDIATVYGQNYSPFGMEKLHKSQLDFMDMVSGKSNIEYSYDKYESEYQESITGLEYYNLDKDVYWKSLDNKDISISGRIIGGCMDIISELSGTKYDGIDSFNDKYKNDGIIWYFDNCELSYEEVIRTLWKFNELGYFKYAKGIIFGRFGREFGYNYSDVKSCLEDSVISGMNIPIISGNLIWMEVAGKRYTVVTECRRMEIFLCMLIVMACL